MFILGTSFLTKIPLTTPKHIHTYIQHGERRQFLHNLEKNHHDTDGVDSEANGLVRGHFLKWKVAALSKLRSGVQMKNQMKS